MIYSQAYWINPQGKIYNIGSDNHIAVVIKHAARFGLRRDAIEECYKRHNETLWTEGKAREEIILQLLSQGFIRIRLYPRYHWSVSLADWRLREQKILSYWAAMVKDDPISGRFMPVVIALPDRIIRDFLVDDLVQEKHIFRENDWNCPQGFCPEIVERITDW